MVIVDAKYKQHHLSLFWTNMFGNMLDYTEILEVYLFAFAYRLFLKLLKFPFFGNE